VPDHYAVKLAIEYLDKLFKTDQPATLVKLLGYVDARDKTVLNLDEVNEVLKQRPNVFVERVDGRVVFNQNSGDREVTKDDLDNNFAIYHAEFLAKCRELEDRKKQGNS
jgi:hypothetical protein